MKHITIYKGRLLLILLLVIPNIYILFHDFGTDINTITAILILFIGMVDFVLIAGFIITYIVATWNKEL